jgi:hypothetical protein
MPLGKHTHNKSGRIRRERNDSHAGNLAEDYPEFERYRIDKELGNIKKELGLPEDAGINTVRKEIRKQS